MGSEGVVSHHVAKTACNQEDVMIVAVFEFFQLLDQVVLIQKPADCFLWFRMIEVKPGQSLSEFEGQLLIIHLPLTAFP